jgi:hypothetical protein
MLFLLSPAKTLDLESPVGAVLRRRATVPEHLEQAALLIERLRTLPASAIAALMDLSDNLAQLNVERYAAWQPVHGLHNSRPAVLTFAGDVYEGLQARTLPVPALDWAQKHLAILSGLYGCLRPMDLIQAHRLEMGTALANPRGRDLVTYWGDTVSETLNRRAAAEGHRLVVNLASQEYARAALRPALTLPVLNVRFEEPRPGGGHAVVSVMAKRARGLMARWAIEQRVRKADTLKAFDTEGYAFAAGVSDDDTWVFRRTIVA